MFDYPKFYKHRNFVDVCFRVIKRQYADSKRLKVKISWYLQKGLRPMGFSETITIDREQIKHYSEIKED